MLAEVAGAAGRFPLAAQSYLDLARRTRDARIARPAAEAGRVPQQADLSPRGRPAVAGPRPGLAAQQLTAGRMTSAARIDELQAQLAKALATSRATTDRPRLAGPQPRPGADPRQGAHPPPRDQLTEPYLDRPEAHFCPPNAAYVAATWRARLDGHRGRPGPPPDWEQAVILQAQLRQEQSPGARGRRPAGLRRRIPTPASRGSRWPGCCWAGRSSAAREQFELLLQRSPDDRDVVHAGGAAGRCSKATGRFGAEKHLGTSNSATQSQTPCACTSGRSPTRPNGPMTPSPGTRPSPRAASS